jgi:bifunctional DNA-binding transcriptional regulator/antitoxin component of YhaV-PrlF toxin-antitoxin module
VQRQLVVPVRLRRKFGIEPAKIRFIERAEELVVQPLTREYIRSVRGMGRHP